MVDVRTLANQRRRRRLARHQVAHMVAVRSMRHTPGVFAEFNQAAQQAGEAILDMVATVEVAMMWEALP